MFNWVYYWNIGKTDYYGTTIIDYKHHWNPDNYRVLDRGVVRICFGAILFELFAIEYKKITNKKLIVPWNIQFFSSIFIK